ncbi:MAG: helix-turn-helix domain-containing protein [Dehalococcoidia bacterium]
MDRLTNQKREPSTLQAGGSLKDNQDNRGPGCLNSNTQATGASNEKLVYSVQELCDVLGCSLSTVYEALREGKIPSLRPFGRKYLIPCASIHAMLTIAPEGRNSSAE